MKKRLFILLLCTVMTLGIMVSSTPFIALADVEGETEQTGEVEVVKDDASSVIKCDSLFEGDIVNFEKVASSGDFELYFADIKKDINRTVRNVDGGKATNEDGTVSVAAHIFAIKDKKSGEIWYSVPADAAKATSSEKVNEISSALMLTINDRNGAAATVYSSTSVKDGNYKVTKLDNGLQIDYTASDSGKGYNITVPFVLTLNEKGIRVSVNMADIKFEGEGSARLTAVSVMPYFACGLKGTDGYMFVPDGCGALIDNNYVNPNGTVLKYYTYVYDRDPSLSIATKTDVTEPTVMPVFGTKMNNSQAWVAVIDEGDALATIHAAYARTSLPFTSQYVEFNYYARDTFKTTDRWYQKDYVQYAAKGNDCEIAINYYLLTGDDADYFGMAEMYREYLIEKGADGSAVKSDLDMFIETYGALSKKVSKFGFVVNELKSITTFEQAAEMVDKFSAAGISNINLRYTGWMVNGLENLPVKDASPDSVVGSKSDVTALNEKVTATGGNLFMNVDFIETYDSRYGWSLNRYTVRNMINEILEKSLYSIVTGRATGYITYLTAPRMYQKQVDAFLKDYSKYGINSVSSGTLGSLVYSDFTTNDDHYTSRQSTEKYIKETLSTLAESTGNLMVDQGNGYSLAYADTVISAPMYDSGLEITSTDVPFMQIALHGLVTYTESAHNQTSSDKQQQLLRQLETGSAPYYLLTYEDSSIFLDTRFASSNYSTQYEVWMDKAVESYKTVSGVLNGYCDKPITDHKIITDDVRATTYGDSMTVYVNYSDSDYTYNGVKIPANGYISVKEAA